MARDHKDILSRRAFVGRVATVTAGAAVALSATTAGRAKAVTTTQPATPAGGVPHVDGATPPAEGAAVDNAPVAPTRVTETTPPPWEVLAPLSVGAALHGDWKLAGLTAIEDGSSVLTLANKRGREHRIHLCRNDGQPQGLVYTERFDLVVMNGGRGDLPTEEDFGQAVAAVAHAIAANENSRRHDQVLAKLLPQSERLERFASTPYLR